MAKMGNAQDSPLEEMSQDQTPASSVQINPNEQEDLSVPKSEDPPNTTILPSALVQASDRLTGLRFQGILFKANGPQVQDRHGLNMGHIRERARMLSDHSQKKIQAYTEMEPTRIRERISGIRTKGSGPYRVKGQIPTRFLDPVTYRICFLPAITTDPKPATHCSHHRRMDQI